MTVNIYGLEIDVDKILSVLYHMWSGHLSGK